MLADSPVVGGLRTCCQDIFVVMIWTLQRSNDMLASKQSQAEAKHRFRVRAVPMKRKYQDGLLIQMLRRQKQIAAFKCSGEGMRLVGV